MESLQLGQDRKISLHLMDLMHQRSWCFDLSCKLQVLQIRQPSQDLRSKRMITQIGFDFGSMTSYQRKKFHENCILLKGRPFVTHSPVIEQSQLFGLLSQRWMFKQSSEKKFEME
jgi:hypothetical protein